VFPNTVKPTIHEDGLASERKRAPEGVATRGIQGEEWLGIGVEMTRYRLSRITWLFSIPTWRAECSQTL
jgi:hypothetical protein